MPSDPPVPAPEPPAFDLGHLRNAPRFARWLVGVVALAAAAWYLALPRAYHAFKISRAERAAKAAMVAMDRGEWESAGQNALLAIRMAPQNPEALRAAARAATLSGDPGAMRLWQALFDRTTPARDDRILFVRLALSIRRPDLARVQLTALLRTNRHDRDAMALGLAALVEDGRTKDALLAARSLASEYPDSPGTELEFGRALLAAGGPGNRQEARKVLWGLAFRSMPDAFAAVAELTRMPELTPEELRLLARRAPETQTNALFRLLVDHNIRFRLDPKADRDAAAGSVVSLIRRDSPVAERIVALDWLLANAPARHALDVAGVPWYRTNTAVLERRLQAFALLDRWQDVAEQIEDPEVRIDPVYQDLYRAIVATHQGHPEVAAGHLAAAARRAGDNPVQLQLIAGYAESLDQPRAAAEALQPLFVDPNQLPNTAARVLRLLKRVDEIGPMLTALNRLLVLDPSNSALRNEQIWLRLLASDQLPECEREARRLVAERPDQAKYLASLALAWHRQGESSRAYDLMEEHHFGDTNAPIRNRIVHCAALAATGRRDAAQRLARGIPLDGLRSEERSMVQDCLGAKPAP